MGVVAAALAPGALAQNPPAKAKGSRPAKAVRPSRKAPPNAADPLVAKAKEAEEEKQKEKEKEREKERGAFHYRLKIEANDEIDLAASYYPGKPDVSTPVVLLVHEKGRSAKDFEDPITELKGKGLAEHLQGLGYAVLAFDLRGHGANVRKGVSDRGVGEGANLASAWAYLPGGAVSHEGRVSDIASLLLVSPLPSGEGFSFPTLMSAISPRFPVLLMAGERDGPSHDVVKRVRAGVERTRQNRVEFFPSALHGYKLLRLEPRATGVIERFLEATIKLKSVDWEPRYNMQPVAYTDIQVIRHAKPTEAERAKEKEKAQAKEAEKEQGKEQKGEAEKEKAKGEAGGAAVKAPG
jgi:hypothetical protein